MSLFMVILCSFCAKLLNPFFVVHFVTYISKTLHFLTYDYFRGAVKVETTKTYHRIYACIGTNCIKALKAQYVTFKQLYWHEMEEEKYI